MLSLGMATCTRPDSCKTYNSLALAISEYDNEQPPTRFVVIYPIETTQIALG